MNYDKEYNLFNQPFRDPLYYILKNSSCFVLVLLESLHPRIIKVVSTNLDLAKLTEYGEKISKTNGWHFIKNTVYT